ncbi:MAG: D-alanine--D-alanine ligase [Alphaproteobacteria bacterium]|nr:D-alanine--D-alanine ligase [Alphaproteobacteria bacterium]
MMKKVLVLVGGFPAEREVSLTSAQDIAEALAAKGYEVIKHELTDVWKFLDVLRQEKPDVVYNGLYGNWGEDGTIQGLLDLLQIPYTHSGMKASAIGMDKELTKLVAEKNGIKVAPSQKMTAKEFLQQGTSMSMPYVVKPVSDGSSVGVFIIKTPEDLKRVVYEDLTQEVLVEKYIAGRALPIMCLEGKAYVVTELTTNAECYDSDAQSTGGITTHELPAQIPDDVRDVCRHYAEVLHKALGCRTVSRIDVRWNPTDGPVFLEINTNPGMTSLSLVPEQAKFAGISYADLCAKLVDNASCRKRVK